MSAKSSSSWWHQQGRRQTGTIVGYCTWVAVCFVGVQLLVALLFVLTQAAGVPYGNFGENAVLLVLRLVTLVLLAAAVVYLPQLLRRPRVTTRTILGLNRPVQWRDIGVGVLGVVVAFVGSMIVLMLTQVFLKWINVAETQDLGLATMRSSLELGLTFVTLVVVGPFIEELVFRGYLYGWLRKCGIGFWPTTLVVSALFGLVHLQWNVALDVFVLSIVMCYAREKTGSIWASVIIHALKNAIAFYFVFVVAA